MHAPQERLLSQPGVTVESECLTCGKQFTRRLYASHVAKGAKGLYCSKGCAGKARWLGHGSTAPRRIIRQPDHPLASDHGKVLEYRAVLYDKIGPGEHPCHWCGTLVRWQRGGKGRGHRRGELAVDHLDGDTRNNASENLVPACNRCNTLRGLMAAWQQATGLPVSHLMP